MQEEPSYYAIIPANVRYDKNLKPNEKLLYGEITALCDKNGYCWATNKYFADLYNVTKISISNWISNLEKSGYIMTKIVYKENHKEIDKRLITIIKDSVSIKEDTYIKNFKDPIKEIFNTPIKEKFKENNTSRNNTRLIIKEIDKEKIIKETNEEVNKETISPILLIDKFIELCPTLPKPLKTVKTRNKNLINLFHNKNLLNEDDEPLFETMDDWITYLKDYVSKSSFLMGNNKTGWKADIDFIIKPSNVVKIYEGKYFNNND